MRLPRARFTVRRMMVAVAIVGVILGEFAAGVHWERNRQETAWQAARARARVQQALLESTVRQVEAAEMQRLRRPTPALPPDPPEPE